MLGQLQRIQPEALDAPDFVGIGAKPARQDGQRGRRNGGGSPWVPSTPVGTTEAQGDDMNSVVEVAGEHSRGETDAADFAQDERRRIIEEARDLDEWEPANSDYNSDDDANTRIKKNL